uniref:Uncharacterized protein n=1 Tax=Anopheles farauti TaxID=69004 RepID=A0A182QIJ3_9DIPT
MIELRNLDPLTDTTHKFVTGAVKRHPIRYAPHCYYVPMDYETPIGTSGSRCLPIKVAHSAALNKSLEGFTFPVGKHNRDHTSCICDETMRRLSSVRMQILLLLLLLLLLVVLAAATRAEWH